MTMPFNTLAYAEQLKRAGFTDEQARLLAEARLELAEAQRDIETLKGGRPASLDELNQLKLRLIPAETLLGNWTWVLGLVAMIAAGVTLLMLALVVPGPP